MSWTPTGIEPMERERERERERDVQQPDYRTDHETVPLYTVIITGGTYWTRQALVRPLLPLWAKTMSIRSDFGYLDYSRPLFSCFCGKNEALWEQKYNNNDNDI